MDTRARVHARALTHPRCSHVECKLRGSPRSGSAALKVLFDCFSNKTEKPDHNSLALSSVEEKSERKSICKRCKCAVAAVYCFSLPPSCCFLNILSSIFCFFSPPLIYLLSAFYPHVNLSFFSLFIDRLVALGVTDPIGRLLPFSCSVLPGRE